MCGYINDCAEDAPSEDILAQFGEAMKRHAGQRLLKIYTSGSFLDDDLQKPLSNVSEFHRVYLLVRSISLR